MKRRTFIGSVVALGLSAIGKHAQAEDMDTTSPVDRFNSACDAKEFFYKGYKVHWTGWKSSAENHYLAGQWVASKAGDDQIHYSSHPGVVSSGWRGGNFYLAIQEGQTAITAASSIEDAILARDEAKRKLLEYLDDSHRNG